MRVQLMVLLMFAGSALFCQKVFTNNEDFLKSISNLPKPLVEMVEQKVEKLPIAEKNSLLTISEMRTSTNSAASSIKLHNTMHVWMEKNFTKEENSILETSMRTSLKKSN